MTDTTVLTCATLYETDPTFVSAIAKWVHDKRCPIQLGDYLEELGLCAAADCARWCATEPDRKVWLDAKQMCGPFPDAGLSGARFYWCFLSWCFLGKHGRQPSSCNEIPQIYVNDRSSRPLKSVQVETEILWLLDNWIARS